MNKVPDARIVGNKQYAGRNPAIGRSARTLAIAACLVPIAGQAQELGVLSPDTQRAMEPFRGLEVRGTTDPEAHSALTDIRSVVELGVGYQSADAFRFGRFTGLVDQGAVPLFSLDLRARAAFDSGGTAHWSIIGSNLGLNSRSLRAELGAQGSYKLFVEYDQSYKAGNDAARTPYLGAGGVNLSLPSGWVASPTTAGMTQLLPSLQAVNMDLERRALSIGGTKALGKGWEFKTSFRNELKDGVQPLGALVGAGFGAARASLLPEPVDYVTRQADVTLAYADPWKQLQLSYHLSLFNNMNESLVWQNPYSNNAGSSIAANYPIGLGRMSLPPDNQFHQVAAAFGYSLSDETRLSGDLALGRMTQDETFLPYTINAFAASSLPRASLNGRIDTTLFNLKLASRPTPQFNWSLGLRHDDRANKTPRDMFNYIRGDGENQIATANSSQRMNDSYSYTEQQLKLDAGYKVARNVDLTAGLERSQIDRTYQERDQSTQSTYRAGLRWRINEAVDGTLLLSRSDRSGSPYVGNAPVLAGYSAAYLATNPAGMAGGWELLPTSRKFHEADRLRDKLALVLTATPADNLTLGLNAAMQRDDYTSSEKGLTGSTSANYTLDATLVAAANLSIYGFYTNERLMTEQASKQLGGATKLADAADRGRDWFASHRDRVETIGLGMKHKLLGQRLELGADFMHSRSKANVNVTTGATVAAASQGLPLPDASTKLNALSVFGNYKWNKSWALRLRYMFEDFNSSDWKTDIAVNQLANTISIGDLSPTYQVHFIGISVTYQF